MAVDLHPHQQEAVNKLSNGKILWGGTGVGKSITAMAYFWTKVCGGVLNDRTSVRHPHDIYVITSAKKRNSLDWEAEAAAFGIGKEEGATVPGVRLVAVDSWNNIEKYREVRDAFFVFDEQRVVGSGAWAKSFIEIAKHNQWILLSATPGDTWLDYIPVFLANGFYKNRTAFMREHVVYKRIPNQRYQAVDYYLATGKLLKLRNQILVHMPYERHTTRHIETICVDYDKDLFEKVSKKRWHVYEERPLRDVAELFAVMRKVANSDASRLDQVRKLLKTHPRLIVFYNFDYELEELRKLAFTPSEEDSSGAMRSTISSGSKSELENGTLSSMRNSGDKQTRLLPSKLQNSTIGTSSKDAHSKSIEESLKSSSSLLGRSSTSSTSTVEESSKWSPTEQVQDSLVVAEWNGHKHQEVPKTERWVYLVQYAAGAEAWNCTDTDAMVFYSLTYSYKHYFQAQGRIDRLNTPFKDLWYYVLKSDSLIDKAIWRSLSEKHDFNESSFLKAS